MLCHFPAVDISWLFAHFYVAAAQREGRPPPPVPGPGDLHGDLPVFPTEQLCLWHLLLPELLAKFSVALCTQSS